MKKVKKLVSKTIGGIVGFDDSAMKAQNALLEQQQQAAKNTEANMAALASANATNLGETAVLTGDMVGLGTEDKRRKRTGSGMSSQLGIF